jgi:hypothetical protein
VRSDVLGGLEASRIVYRGDERHPDDAGDAGHRYQQLDPLILPSRLVDPLVEAAKLACQHGSGSEQRIGHFLQDRRDQLGRISWAIPRATPSSTASSTMPIVSSSRATRCAGSSPMPPQPRSISYLISYYGCGVNSGTYLGCRSSTLNGERGYSTVTLLARLRG